MVLPPFDSGEPTDWLIRGASVIGGAALTHHEDCDGYRMHSVEAHRLPDGTYKALCPLCGELPMVGSAGSPATAISLNRDHSRADECAGECAAWSA